MAELTVADLLAWEPRLRLPETHSAPDMGTNHLAPRASADLEREISWAVTVRASAPMLPALRGGEVVLLPKRVVSEAGIALPDLLRELARHPLAAVVSDITPPPEAPVPVLVLVTELIPADFESEINRLLTERRGDLYRAGTELERVITALTAAGEDLARVLAATAGSIDIPAAVVDAHGAVLALSAPRMRLPSGLTPRDGWRDGWLSLGLSGERRLVLGPIAAERRALARLIANRVASAVEAALSRAAASRPRGQARIETLTTLLTSTGQPDEATALASTLGLPVDGAFRVALASPSLGSGALGQALAPYGRMHDAGMIDGAVAALIEGRGGLPANDQTPSPSVNSRDCPRQPTLPGVSSSPGEKPPRWLAISGPVRGPAALPEAGRQARFVAVLLARGALPGPVARFDAPGDLGAYGLFYHLWGEAALEQFAAAALGDIASHDRRGTLRQTLLAYLISGGSHTLAAKELGIHRNTLAYRLKLITKLTGRDPTDPAMRLPLHLALLATALPPVPLTN